MRPQIRLTKVVLPAPFGPITARDLAGMQREIDHVDGLQAAEDCGRDCVAMSSACHGSHLTQRSRTVPRMPLGKNRTSRMSAAPTMPRWLTFQPGSQAFSRSLETSMR